MAEIGLFPLGVALLPSEVLPLHIFEDRYRELIEECISGPTPFGLLYADEAGMRSVGTEARVAHVLDRFDDGRLNIAVLGIERFRVVRLTEGRSFGTAEVEPWTDEQDDGPVSPIEACVAAADRIAAASEVDSEADFSGARSAFELAARIQLPEGVKQELIEMRSERRRLARLQDLLERFAGVLERRNEIRIRAAGNGRAELS
jgi:Lon protease-like protein